MAVFAESGESANSEEEHMAKRLRPEPVRRLKKKTKKKRPEGMPGFIDFSDDFGPGEIVQAKVDPKRGEAWVDIRYVSKRKGGVTLFYAGTVDEMIDWLIEHRDHFSTIVVPRARAYRRLEKTRIETE